MRDSNSDPKSYTFEQLEDWNHYAEQWTREAREEAAKPTTSQRMASLGWSVVK